MPHLKRARPQPWADILALLALWEVWFAARMLSNEFHGERYSNQE